MKIKRKNLIKIIKEELERLSFAKDHDYGVDVIPRAKKDKSYDDIIGHTWLTHVRKKGSSLNEVGYVLWHSLNERGEINYYDIEWPDGSVETDVPSLLLEKVKDSKDLDEVHESHGVKGHKEGSSLNEKKRKKRKRKNTKSKYWYLGGYGIDHDHDVADFGGGFDGGGE